MPLSNLDSEKPLIREKRLEVDQYRLNSVKDGDEDWQEFRMEDPEDSRLMFNDELWDQEWYLVMKQNVRFLLKTLRNVWNKYNT